jgi:hypothetical protein
MFSLIISIISIALVAALALATIYYGGDNFNKGSAAAKASQLINEGQQIAGAIAMNVTDAVSDSSLALADVASLAPGYLTQIPADWDTTSSIPASGHGVLVTLDGGSGHVGKVTDKVCTEINKRAGIDESVARPTGAVSGKAYGCYGDATKPNENQVFYRF